MNDEIKGERLEMISNGVGRRVSMESENGGEINKGNGSGSANEIMQVISDKGQVSEVMRVICEK